jgi:hypothetical protein
VHCRSHAKCTIDARLLCVVHLAAWPLPIRSVRLHEEDDDDEWGPLIIERGGDFSE